MSTETILTIVFGVAFSVVIILWVEGIDYMKKYVVGILSMFDHDLKLFKIDAENKYEALKKGMVEYTSEEDRHYEIEFQNGEVCPPTFEGLTDYYANGEIMTEVIKL